MQQIPLIDIRESNTLAVLEAYPDKARALIAASRHTFGRFAQGISYLALPVADAIARRWLTKSQNPYREEIADFSRFLGSSGIYALNLSYEAGCTSGVYATPEGARLLRVLDWPFDGLGLHMVVAHQRGVAGEFHNITWPGANGVYTAVAKGRFAVALNQAPMRRHKSGIRSDWFKNRRMWWNSNALPPAHLLRQVCETATTFEQAKDMLLRTPVCIPVIYILSGLRPSEGCVIERLEEGAALREMNAHPSVSAANHFLSHLNGVGYGWRPREVDSCGRAVCAGIITSREAANPEMPWFKPPVANHNSRVCFSANAATGSLSLRGTQGETPVTELFRL